MSLFIGPDGDDQSDVDDDDDDGNDVDDDGGNKVYNKDKEDYKDEPYRDINDDNPKYSHDHNGNNDDNSFSNYRPQ